MSEKQSEDIFIKPMKVVKKVHTEPTSSEGKTDIKKVQEEYDSRLYSSVSLPDELSHIRLYNFFNFEQNDKQSSKQNDKLKLINTWVKDKVKSDELFDIINNLSSLGRELGVPDYGVSKLDHFYNYIKIEHQINQLERERFMRYQK